MHIHFVCRANIWRSRIAEAYAWHLLKELPAITVDSSGIEAGFNVTGGLPAHTESLLERYELLAHASETTQQTTQELIDAADSVVFANKDVYQDAKLMFRISDQATSVWDIPDRLGVEERIFSSTERLLVPYLKSKKRP